MDSSYDENIEENVFFKTLRTEYDTVFQQAIGENWTICVPSSESLEQYELSQRNLFTHILVPNDELPGTHFRNLNNDEVRIYDRLVKLQDSQSVPILFTEVFYADETTRYDVLCLECPLNFTHSSQKFNPRLYSVKSLKDCVDLLTHESSTEQVLKKLDEVIKQFLFLSSKNYFRLNLDQQVEFVREIYRRCLQIVLHDKKVQAKMKVNHVFMENVQVAVESYVLHNIYSIIMKGIITNLTDQIGEFNKTLRNLANIQLQHLKVTDTQFDSILRARTELSHFNHFNTVLGKLSCFKRCINHLSTESADKLSVDDLLPILVFLVVKSGITTWSAQLEYVKRFSFSHMNENHANESSFLVTTLEAIITFIHSGLFYKSIYSSEWNLIKSLDGASDVCTYICAKSKHFWKTKHSALLKLFQHIYDDDLKSISALLDDQEKAVAVPAAEAQYCHPLCSCDRCEKLFANSAIVLTVNSVNESGYSALHVAACYGKCNIVDWLLSKGANPNCRDFSGSTPLHCAAQHGYQNTLLLLIYAEARLNPRDDEGHQPLHYAAVNGHMDCVKALLYYAEQARVALDVNATNEDGDTALHLAVKYYQKEIAGVLLNYNANPALKNKHGNTVFELTDSLSIKKLLNEKYDSVNLLTNSVKMVKAGYTLKKSSDVEFGEEVRSAEAIKLSSLLFKAAKNNDIATMKGYLGVGRRSAEVGRKKASRYECHPLCRCQKCCTQSSTTSDDEDAGWSGRVNATIDANACDSDGFTALHIACKYGRNEAIKFLLDAGAKINVRTYKQLLTPLHIVCIQNQLNSARTLLKRNTCQVNLRDRNGNTALHYACMADNLRIVELLLQYEPDLALRNDRGKTCLNEAEESLSYGVMRVLKAFNPCLKEELLW